MADESSSPSESPDPPEQTELAVEPDGGKLPGVAEPAEAAPAAHRSDRELVAAWMVSLGVHVVLFTLMVLIPWISAEMAGGDSVAVTSTQIQDDGDSDVKTRMVADKPTLNQHQQKTTADEQIKPERRNTLSELNRVRSNQPAIVGIGTGGGDFSEYGLQASSGGGGPRFFGLGPGDRAVRSIVYVVDRSASMLEVFDDVRKETKRSVSRLRKSQKFHLIFYSADDPLRHPPKKMVNAIRTAKEAAYEFIDSVPVGGGTNELPALERAFALKPDIIYFLSDGNLYDREVLLEQLRQWNAKKRVRIFTIAFVFPEGKELLEQIAREHNGGFRYVSEYDLD